jgi:hypothetical protein
MFPCSRSPVIGRPKSQPKNETSLKRKRLSDVFANKDEEIRHSRTQPDIFMSKDEEAASEKAPTQNFGDSINVDMFGDDEFLDLLPPQRKVT